MKTLPQILLLTLLLCLPPVLLAEGVEFRRVELSLADSGDIVLDAEIHYGLSRLVEGSRRRQLLHDEYTRLREQVAWVDWTEAAATEYGRQKALLETQGMPIGDMDLAIGSVALALGARLATFNVRHLDRLDGLVVDDWTPAADR